MLTFPSVWNRPMSTFTFWGFLIGKKKKKGKNKCVWGGGKAVIKNVDNCHHR